MPVPAPGPDVLCSRPPPSRPGSPLMAVPSKCQSQASASHSTPVQTSARGDLKVRAQRAEVLKSYQRMVDEGVRLSKDIFVSVLKACSSFGDLDEGKRVHEEILRQGYGSDVCIGNTLLHMYANCGSIVDATYAFDSMPKRSVVSWNAMISAHCHHEQAEKAFQLYTEMREQGDIAPNDRTFVSAIRACSSLAAEEGSTPIQGQLLKVDSLQKGKEMHVEVNRRGLLSDSFVGASLINMFAYCGSMMDAQLVFDSMPEHSVVSWNTMIGGYADQNDFGRCLELYVRMQNECFTPTDRTFVNLIKACCNFAAGEPSTFVGKQAFKVNSLVKGKVLHAAVVQSSYSSDSFVASALVNMYACCGSIPDARHVFDSLSLLDEVVWNTMIAGYCQQELGEQALQLYMQMEAKGVRPSETTFLSTLRACSQLGALDTCSQMHFAIVKNGFDKCANVAHALINAYGKCGSMMNALQVFQSLPQHDTVAWNTLLAGYARQGEWEMLVQYFDKMVQTGMKPDGVTFVSLLSACSHAGMVDKGLEYFDLMRAAYGISARSEHYASMVDLLGRAGKFTLVEDLIAGMPMQPTSSLWLSLLGSCRKYGEVCLGRRVFDHLQKADAKQSAPYALMAQVYAQAGMWEDAIEINELKHRSGAVKTPGQSWIEQDFGVHMFSAQVSNQGQRN